MLFMSLYLKVRPDGGELKNYVKHVIDKYLKSHHQEKLKPGSAEGAVGETG